MNNEPSFNNDFPEGGADFAAETSEQFRRHAGTAFLIALGLGVATAALVHAFRPAPRPRQRMVRMLGEMEDSLREMSAPAMHRVGSMASDGAHALGEHLGRSEAQLEKFLRGATRQLRRLTSRL